MKTLKTVALVVCLFVAGTAAKANKISDADKAASQYNAINTYVNAVNHGKLENINQVIDNTAKFNYLRGNNILSFDKADAMQYFQYNKGIEQGYNVTTSVVSSNADVAIVKVDMQHDALLRSDYLTLTSEGDTWKITNVYSVFK